MLSWVNIYKNTKIGIHPAYAHLVNQPGENTEIKFNLSRLTLYRRLYCHTLTR